MRKRSLWSQHICYRLIPLPTLPEVEREDVRDVFPWYSSHLAQSPTEKWELSTSSRDRSKWTSIGKMVTDCEGGWLYPKSSGFCTGEASSVSVWVWGVMLTGCSGDMGAAKLTKVQAKFTPTSGPELAFCQRCLQHNLGLAFYMFWGFQGVDFYMCDILYKRN